MLVESARRRNVSVGFNAALALAGTLLPGALEERFDLDLTSWQRLYVEAGMLTHAVGMLGLYDDVWWWDHLTHTHSASILAGMVHVAARRRGDDPRPRVLAAVVLGGLVWEALEYLVHRFADRLGIEPLLVVYGPEDTVLDLCFDGVGALLVLAFGDRLLENLTPAQDGAPA